MFQGLKHAIFMYIRQSRTKHNKLPHRIERVIEHGHDNPERDDVSLCIQGTVPMPCVPDPTQGPLHAVGGVGVIARCVHGLLCVKGKVLV